MLLGEYLRANRLGDFRLRSGQRQLGESSTTHAWLEQDLLVVDITADQFPDVADAVFVGRGSSWHEQWTPIAGSCIASLAYYDQDDHRDLVRDMYDRLSAAATDAR